jgi:hypothetical protein
MQALFEELVSFGVLFSDPTRGSMDSLRSRAYGTSCLGIRYAVDEHQPRTLTRRVFAADQSRDEIELSFCHLHGGDGSWI